MQMSDSQVLADRLCGSVGFACLATMQRNWVVSWCLQVKLMTGLLVHPGDTTPLLNKDVWLLSAFLKLAQEILFHCYYQTALFWTRTHRSRMSSLSCFMFQNSLLLLCIPALSTSNGFCNKHRIKFSKAALLAYRHCWALPPFHLQQVYIRSRVMYLTCCKEIPHFSFPEYRSINWIEVKQQTKLCNAKFPWDCEAVVKELHILYPQLMSIFWLPMSDLDPVLAGAMRPLGDQCQVIWLKANHNRDRPSKDQWKIGGETLTTWSVKMEHLNQLFPRPPIRPYSPSVKPPIWVKEETSLPRNTLKTKVYCLKEYRTYYRMQEGRRSGIMETLSRDCENM